MGMAVREVRPPQPSIDVETASNVFRRLLAYGGFPNTVESWINDFHSEFGGNPYTDIADTSQVKTFVV